MMPDSKVVGGGLLVLLLSLEGCSAWNSPLSPAAPLFRPEPKVAQRLQALAREQEAQLAACPDGKTCAPLHFTRALVALFENRSLARTHFQKAVTTAPNSPAGSSSAVWLDLLQSKPPDLAPTHPLVRVTEQMVHDLLEREMTNRQLTKDLEASSVQELQHALKARERKIEDLTKQLDALKRIDQEMNEKTRQDQNGKR